MTKDLGWGILPPGFPPAVLGAARFPGFCHPGTAVPLPSSTSTKPLHTLCNGWDFQGPGLSHLSEPLPFSLPLLSEFSQTLGAQRPPVPSRSSGCACQNTFKSAVCLYLAPPAGYISERRNARSRRASSSEQRDVRCWVAEGPGSRVQ